MNKVCELDQDDLCEYLVKKNGVENQDLDWVLK